MKLIEERLEKFFDIAYERHMIYVKKEILKEEKPWTDDPIFQTNRFCNVFRKIDKVSQYLINNVIKPNENNDLLYKGIIIAKVYNRISTISRLIKEDVLFPVTHMDYQRLMDVLVDIVDSGNPVFTSSYTVNPLQINKIYYPKYLTGIVIAKQLDEKLGDLDLKLSYCISMQSVFNDLLKITGIGKFNAYEYVTDFCYADRYWAKIRPKDYYTWGNFTIGSLRGLKRLVGLSPHAKVKLDVPKLTQEILERWTKDHTQNYPFHEAFRMFDDLSMREVEHWLCEYDKYMRIFNGETKRLKRRYNGLR